MRWDFYGEKLPNWLICRRSSLKAWQKGEFVLTEDEDERLCGIFDETINRLKQNVNNECPEQNIDAEDYEYLKLEVKSITLF
jgi:hypothetical protein